MNGKIAITLHEKGEQAAVVPVDETVASV
jgi:hypothetical protein